MPKIMGYAGYELYNPLQEETRVWDSHGMHRVHGIAELVARVSEMNAWVRADEGFPKVLSKAYTDDGGCYKPVA